MSTRHAYFWLVVTAIAFGLVWLLRDTLAPFLFGMVIAYLINPSVSALSRKMPRAMATGVVLVAFLAVLVGFLMIVTPMIGRQALAFFNDIPQYTAALQQWSAPHIEQFLSRLGPEEVAKIRDAAGNQFGNVLKGARDIFLRLWSGGMALVDLVMLIVITPVVAFYCLRDWPGIVTRIRNLFPRDSAKTLETIFAECDTRLAGFLRGQLLVCICLGLIYGVALSLAGLNFGMAIGFSAGILSFIPYVGSIFGFAASVGVALFQFDGFQMPLVVAAIFFVGQFIEGNFLTPKLVGSRIGLHPVWVIFALMAGGQLFGFTGLLLAVPVAAMIGVAVRHALIWYEKSPAYRGGGN